MLYTLDKYNQQFNDHNEISGSVSDIKFGTAGIRSKMEQNYSGINPTTVAVATRAFGMTLLKKNKKPSVVVARDNRENGKLFTDIIGSVLTALGIKVYVAKNKGMIATPMLSYSIMKLKATGGINITASHNSKEYNGFKVYGKDGGQLIPEMTEEIEDIIHKTNDLSVIKFTTPKFEFIKNELFSSYVDSLVKGKEIKDIKVSYSSLAGTGSAIAHELFNKLNIDSHIVEEDGYEASDFNGIINPNPENDKSFKKVMRSARREKSDLAIITDPDADRFGIVAKYKRRYKYLTANQMALLILDNIVRGNQFNKDSYIVMSEVSSYSVHNYAKAHGIKVVVTPVGFKNISDAIITNGKKNFLFAFEESYGMLMNPNISMDKDGFQGAIESMAVASSLKKEGKTLFSRLLEIQKSYGFYRNIQLVKKADAEVTKKLIKKLMRVKQVAGSKIKEEIKRSNGKSINYYQLNLADGSRIIIRPSGTEPKLKIYIETVSKGESIMHSVIREREITNFINEMSEEFPEKKLSWKGALKYSIFLGIMALTLYFVFEVIYGVVAGSKSKETGYAIFNNNASWIFLIFIVGWAFSLFLSSLQRKKLIQFHGQKVKFRHIYISTIMGQFISWITPFAIGGDGVGYWYMRRQGFKRGPLISSYLTSTIVYQFSMIIFTAVLLPFGLDMFKDVLFNGSVHSKAVMWLFITGLIWDLFSSIMIITLSTSRIFQEWIVKTAIKLLEWLPFVRISDPGSVAAGYQYEFQELRIGMKKLWKSKSLMSEVFIYEILNKLFAISAFGYIALGIVQGDLKYGSYFSQLIANDVIGSANSLSITPGGSGTGEYITINIKDKIYDIISPGTSGSETAAGMDMIYKFFVVWPTLGISVMMILTIIAGEKRVKYNKINNQKSSTRFYRIVTIPWVAAIGTYFTVLLTITL